MFIKKGRIKLKTIAVAIVAIALSGCVSRGGRASWWSSTLGLAENGRPLADIVLSAGANEAERFAAEELRMHLSTMTGGRFCVTNEAAPGRIPILVRRNSALADQESRISFSDSGIALESGEHPEYAVWDFLHDYCGVKWLDPTDAGTVIIWKPDLAVERRDSVSSPFAKGRNPGGWSGGSDFSAGYSPELWEWGTEGWTNYLHSAYPSAFYDGTFEEALAEINRRKGLFLRRMKAGGEYACANHSFYGWYDRFWDKSSPRFERFRPELFAQGYEDEARPPQLCYSNPETVSQVVADVRRYFDGGGSRWGKDVCCIEPMDNAKFCRCPRCASQYRPDMEDAGSEHGDYWFRFVNTVAREVAKTHPGGKVATLAYWSHTAPPSFRLEPNVIVHYCFTMNRMPYAVGGWEREVGTMREWRREYPERPFGLWLYNTFPKERVDGAPRFNVFPGFFAHVLKGEYELIRELDMSEVIFNCGFVDDYENFLSLRWMWNPGCPLAELEEEYFAWFGAAAEPIREFYHIVEERYVDPASYCFEKKGTSPQQNEQVAWGHLGTPEVMSRLSELMAQAERAADTPKAKARVANWRRGIWDYMCEGAETARLKGIGR